MSLWKQHHATIASAGRGPDTGPGAGAHHVSDVASYAVTHGGELPTAAHAPEDLQVLRGALHGDADRVRDWIAAGGDANARNRDGFTPLHTAAAAGAYDVVKVLLAAGASASVVDGAGNSPAHIAAAANAAPVLRLLAVHGVDLDAPNPESGELPLGAALGARPAATDAFDALIALGADIDALDTDGWALLHHAAAWNATDDIARLVAAGASITVRTAGDPGGDTPAHIAVARGYVESLPLLLAPDVVAVANSAGRTLLHEAALGGRVRSTYAVLAAGYGVSLPAIISELDVLDPHAPSIEADAERLGVPEAELVLDALAPHGLDNAGLYSTVRAGRDAHGHTPLALAARAGHFEVALALLRAGAPANVPNGRNGRSPLHEAVDADAVLLVRLLLLAGALPDALDDAGNTPLHVAARTGSSPILDVLLPAVPPHTISSPNAMGLTPLHTAVLHGSKVSVARLVAAGAALDAVTERGQTPIQLAQDPDIYAALDAASQSALLSSMHGGQSDQRP